MRIAIQGSKGFNQYEVFLSGMGRTLAMMEPGDPEFLIYSVGPARTNEMAMEFSNISERSLKARGIKIRLFKVPPTWLKQNMHDMNYFAYFCNKKEPVSSMVEYAEGKDIEVGIYRF
jgi:hypothetical protein